MENLVRQQNSGNLDDLLRLGAVLAQSGMFNDARQEAQAVVKVLAGRELGFGPIASMTGVHVINGKVTLSANLMAAAIKRTGKYNYRIRAHTDAECTLEFFEGDESVGQSSFTMEDARKAGLTKNPTWSKFPRNMLFARALSNGARWFCPDAFGGPVYTPEEMGAEVDEEGELVEPQVTIEAPQEHATNGIAAEFYAAAQSLARNYDEDTVKATLKELGYKGIPKDEAGRQFALGQLADLLGEA